MPEISKEQKKLRDRLRPGTELHGEILTYVRDCFKLSQQHFSGRHEKWRSAENLRLSYVDPDEKDSNGNKLYPFGRSIIVPYTYAILQTRLTYFFLALTGKTPIVPINGRGPRDIIPAKMQEAVIEYQMQEQSGSVVYYGWLQDSETYGVGIVKNIWHRRKEERWATVNEKVTFFSYEIPGLSRKVKKRVDQLIYEGNLLVNVTPYRFFPDPRVNVCDLHSGEFVGHLVDASYSHLLNQSRQGEYFNIEFLKKRVSVSNNIDTDFDEFSHDSSNLAKIVGISPTSISTTVDGKDQGYHSLKELHCLIIPKDRKFSNYPYPEEWIITVADDNIIIKCEPSESREHPFYVIESNHDYASPANQGSAELLKGLNDILSWMFNSHIESAQRALNDVLVINPYFVDMNDLLSGDPVKIIKLKQEAYMMPGGIDSYIKQLQFNDVTRSHITDSQQIMNLMQRVSAATDNVMGMVEEVKRTATETSTTTNLATSRLKMILRLMCALGIIPMTRNLAYNNTQLLEEEQYYNITDDMAKELGYDPVEIKNRILIGPDKMYGLFNYTYPSAELPIDRVQTANVWLQMLREVSQNEILMQKFDMVPIFNQWAYNMGATNVSDFHIKPKTLPNEEVEKQVGAGNLVPNLVTPELIQRMQEMVGSRLNGGNGNGVPNVGAREFLQ